MGYSDAAPYGAIADARLTRIVFDPGGVTHNSPRQRYGDERRRGVVRHQGKAAPCHFDPRDNNPTQRLIRLNL